MTNLHTKFRRIAAGLMLTTLTLAACSGSDDNPTGSTTPPPPMDEVTVVFNSLTAILDCDGPDNPGDFYYSLNVDTIDADGNVYLVSRFGERQATLSNGVTRLNPFGVSFLRSRERYTRFQVRLTVRESDGANNDFTRSTTYQHRFNNDFNEAAWSSYWDQSKRQGSEAWEIKLRDRQTNWIGSVTEDGCHFRMTYTVTARQVSK